MSESSRSNRLSSSVEGRLWQIRGELVLQLYVRRGPFWEAVRDARERWNIEAKIQLPPSVASRLLPEDAPEFDDREQYMEYAARWQEEMSTIMLKVISEPPLPTRDFFNYQSEMFWSDFLSACVLYDPPDDRLLEFVSYGSPKPTHLSDPRVLDKGINPEGRPEMVGPPVKSLWDLMEVRDWYWHRILKYIGERYLEPQGVHVETLLEHAMLGIPGLRDEYGEKHRWHSKRHYIEVDEYTTLEDAKKAFQMIRSIQPSRVTKRPRDRLTAVQCALLHDRHNTQDPEDRRRWKWTYASLAEHFNLSSSRAAEDHVVMGREILKGKHLD